MRTHLLLGAACAAALACGNMAVAATTKPLIASGGSSLVATDLIAEYTTFNTAESSSKTVSIFGTGYASPVNLYYTQGSGAGRQAVLYDNMLCLVNGASGNAAACGVAAGNTNPNQNAGGANTTAMAGSDALLSSDEWAIWHGSYTGTSSATTTHGQSTAGNIIQIPSVGTPITLVIKNASVSANNQVSLTDADICGIFSGSITNWNQTSAYIKNPSSLTPGQINVVYRSDSSGTSTIFSAHLSQVCNSANSAFPGASTVNMNNPSVWDPATYTFGAGKFTSLFTNGSTSIPVPSTFIGESGSGAVAAELQGQTSAIGYLSPDFTTISAMGGSSGVNNYGLVVANVNGVEPTTANTLTALENPGAGAVNTALPTATTSAQQDVWVPVTPVVTKGYPIVGYSTFVFPQCFATANKDVATGLIDFLKDHYTISSYLSTQASSGFVTLSSGKKTLLSAIEANILKTSTWNFSIDNSTACAGKAGR